MVAPWVIPLLISVATSYAGNTIAKNEMNKTTRKKLGTEARLREARTKRANDELASKFKNVAEQIGPENEQALLQSEDAKNLQTYNDTEQNSEVKVGQGLNIGGNELAEFTNLKSDSKDLSATRNNARKIFGSQALSPGVVQAQRGNYANVLALDKSRFADELHGQRIGDDLEVSAIKPNAGMLALADAIKIGGQMYGMYNMASGIGAGAGGGTPDLTGLEGIASTGYTAPASAGSVTDLGQAFGNSGGAGLGGFAPKDAFSMWAKPPPIPSGPAWSPGSGGWFGG